MDSTKRCALAKRVRDTFLSQRYRSVIGGLLSSVKINPISDEDMRRAWAQLQASFSMLLENPFDGTANGL